MRARRSTKEFMQFVAGNNPYEGGGVITAADQLGATDPLFTFLSADLYMSRKELKPSARASLELAWLEKPLK